jgi:hypothetical protein
MNDKTQRVRALQSDCPRHIGLHSNPREQRYRRGYGVKTKLDFSCVYNTYSASLGAARGTNLIARISGQREAVAIVAHGVATSPP